jgi:hypothetical protein
METAGTRSSETSVSRSPHGIIFEKTNINKNKYVTFQVLTAAGMKMRAFWDVGQVDFNETTGRHFTALSW